MGRQIKFPNHDPGIQQSPIGGGGWRKQSLYSALLSLGEGRRSLGMVWKGGTANETREKLKHKSEGGLSDGFCFKSGELSFQKKSTANLLGYKQVKGAALVQWLCLGSAPPHLPSHSGLRALRSLPGVTSLLIPEQLFHSPLAGFAPRSVQCLASCSSTQGPSR